MNKTNIDWATMTWNPVTGCLHNCEYCYARKMANRFNSSKGGKMFVDYGIQEMKKHSKGDFLYTAAFQPTFHKDRLNKPQTIKKPQNVFVCSMADLFGGWVTDGIIKAVFEACKKATQHRYIFLTKNYSRYNELRKKGILPLDTNMYFGASVTTERQLKQACLYWENIDFLSIEPLMEYMGVDEWFVDGNLKPHWKWVIAGAETGNRKDKIIPEFDWVEDIVYHCGKLKIPLFMKNSLSEIWRKPLIQEYPWEGGNSQYGNA